MTRTKMLLLTLLLAPAAASAATVVVDWSGQIDAYAAAPGSSYPQTLSDTSISGAFTFNTNLLPPPDAGNPAGVVSFTGSGFMQSTVQWSGGTFTPEPPGSSGSSSLYIDTNADECTIQDSSTYMDALGIPHQAMLNLDVSGLIAATATGFSVGTVGSGYFWDLTTPSDGSAPGGFEAFFTTDSVTVGVPGPDTASLSVGMLLAVMVAFMRGRRKEACKEA